MPPPGAYAYYWSVSYLSQLFIQLSVSTIQAVFLWSNDYRGFIATLELQEVNISPYRIYFVNPSSSLYQYLCLITLSLL